MTRLLMIVPDLLGFLSFTASGFDKPDDKPAPKTGAPVDGLAAQAEIVKENGKLAVRFGLKNVSDKPLMICDYVANRPLQVEWTGPDGKKRKCEPYAWLDDPRIGPQAPLAERDFVKLAPGDEYLLGPNGKGTAISLPGAEAGEHKVVVRFVNKEDGKTLKITAVWTGTVEAPEVKLTAPR